MSRKTLDRDDGAPRQRTRRCLDGLALMLVDDSRSVSEAIRMMATASGARIRRADCLASAARHMSIFRPDVIIIDLSLPDGNGTDLARTIADGNHPKPGILIVSGADEDVAAIAVDASGADGFLLKPIESLQAFQNAVLAVCPGHADQQPDWTAEFSHDLSDSDALTQDYRNALDMLAEATGQSDPTALRFCAQFLRGTAATAGDDELVQLCADLSQEVRMGGPGAQPAAALDSALRNRLSGRWAEAS